MAPVLGRSGKQWCKMWNRSFSWSTRTKECRILKWTWGHHVWGLHSRLPEFSLETGPEPFSYLTPRLLSHKKRRVGNRESIYESPIGVLCQDTFSGVSRFKPKERGHARPLGESDMCPLVGPLGGQSQGWGCIGHWKDTWAPWWGLDADHSQTECRGEDRMQVTPRPSAGDEDWTRVTPRPSAMVRTGRRSLQDWAPGWGQNAGHSKTERRGEDWTRVTPREALSGAPGWLPREAERGWKHCQVPRAEQEGATNHTRSTALSKRTRRGEIAGLWVSGGRWACGDLWRTDRTGNKEKSPLGTPAGPEDKNASSWWCLSSSNFPGLFSSPSAAALDSQKLRLARWTRDKI